MHGSGATAAAAFFGRIYATVNPPRGVRVARDGGSVLNVISPYWSGIGTSTSIGCNPMLRSMTLEVP
jgi:hypothetical protein